MATIPPDGILITAAQGPCGETGFPSFFDPALSILRRPIIDKPQ
jgi:hypothetical protein